MKFRGGDFSTGTTGNFQPELTTAPFASRVASAARATTLCAGHDQQLGGASPLPNRMEVKG